jgi:hypothetical protein
MENLNIDDFKDYLESIEKSYDDDDLNIILKTCVNTLFIMYERGYDLPKKALLEIQKNI